MMQANPEFLTAEKQSFSFCSSGAKILLILLPSLATGYSKALDNNYSTINLDKFNTGICHGLMHFDPFLNSAFLGQVARHAQFLIGKFSTRRNL